MRGQLCAWNEMNLVYLYIGVIASFQIGLLAGLNITDENAFRFVYIMTQLSWLILVLLLAKKQQGPLVFKALSIPSATLVFIGSQNIAMLIVWAIGKENGFSFSESGLYALIHGVFGLVVFFLSIQIYQKRNWAIRSVLIIGSLLLIGKTTNLTKAVGSNEEFLVLIMHAIDPIIWLGNVCLLWYILRKRLLVNT